MVHNIDTLGANMDPAMLGCHIDAGKTWTTEVIRRRIDDRGGGLARADGHVRLIEGLALPREEIEFTLSYYNSNTAWLEIDRLLALFGLARTDLADEAKVARAVRAMAARMPTYITLKDVKKRWGKGQEDVLPVAQFEKLWGRGRAGSNSRKWRSWTAGCATGPQPMWKNCAPGSREKSPRISRIARTKRL